MKKTVALFLALALMLGLLTAATADELPGCMVPQVAAQYFNGLLAQMFATLGAGNADDRAEAYKLTKASIEGSVLYLMSENGLVELNGFYQNGAPDVAAEASTLGIAVAKSVERSDVIAIGATLAVILSETDPNAGDFGTLLNWISDAVDGGDTAMRPMNGYTLVYVVNDSGHILTIVPDTMGEGGGSAPAPDEPAPLPAVSAAPEPTEAPAPEPTEAPAPLQDSLENAFMEVNGLWIELVDGETSSTGGVWLYFRLLNTSDALYRVQAHDASADGVPVYATSVGDPKPRSDTGTEKPADLLITTLSEYKDEGEKALANPDTIGLTIQIKDEDYHEITSQPIIIDFDTLSVSLGSAPRNTKAPQATPKPQAKAPSTYYQSLARGDKGDDGKRLQQQLIALGYLSDTADGEFGPKTAAAVKAFNEANGFGSSEVATIDMQEWLFSSSAIPWTEPWVPVDVPRYEWKNPTGDGCSYRLKIRNNSKTRTIKGVELWYYPTDVWGNRLWDYDHRATTFNVTVKPGKEAWTQWFYMSPSWYTIQKICIGVSKVAFDDGDIHEKESVTYDWECTLH